jgi:hypothetical protein
VRDGGGIGTSSGREREREGTEKEFGERKPKSRPIQPVILSPEDV